MEKIFALVLSFLSEDCELNDKVVWLCVKPLVKPTVSLCHVKKKVFT